MEETIKLLVKEVCRLNEEAGSIKGTLYALLLKPELLQDPEVVKEIRELIY